MDNYSLFIAEDDGSPDADFPCLEPKEVVAKFGFTSLALVRSSKPANNNPGLNNEATSKKEPGEPSSVNQCNKTDEQSSSNKGEDSQANKAVLESTDYHSFKGFLLHKVRPKTDITLGKFMFNFVLPHLDANK